MKTRGRYYSGTGARDAQEPDKTSACGCVVARHEDELIYWAINPDGDIEIQVETHQHGVPIVALLAGGGVNRHGVWFLPEEGTEGVVVFMEGDFEGDGIFIPMSSGSRGPTDLAPGVVVMAGSQVVAHDGLGGAAKLPTFADLVAQVHYLQQQFDSLTGHTHSLAGSGPPIESIVLPLGSSTVPSPTGTTVFKAK